MNFREEINKILNSLKGLDRKRAISMGLLIGALIILYSINKCSEPGSKTVFHKNNEVSFSNGKILGDNNRSIYKRKEQIFQKKLSNVEKRYEQVDQRLTKIDEVLIQLKQSIDSLDSITENRVDKESDDINDAPVEQNKLNDNVSFSDPLRNLNSSRIQSTQPYGLIPQPYRLKSGPEIISFPVQSQKRSIGNAVKLPAGSYLKATLLTGVQAAEGKTLPVLLQADYAFVGPNKTKIDLTGCFLLAKSTGNLSIESVELQSTKISCVSKSGRMFERDLNGFVADAKDNSFAVRGVVESKRGRVASMAFLSSVVEGVGEAIQQAQTTTQVSESGSSSTLVTGNQGRYIAAGGASNAASKITDWYLKHAENLLPTVKVGSGQEVFIVTQETVDLPNWYFKHESQY